MDFTGMTGYVNYIVKGGHCSLAASPQLHEYGSHQEGEMVAFQVTQRCDYC
jgi:hypothetical protein